MSIHFWINVSVVILATYIIRMVPLVAVKKKLNNVWLQSFLYYIPYAVLAAMTFPAILYSTGNLYSGIVGTVVALILAFFEKGLLTVAICSCAGALATELVMAYVIPQLIG